jgi:hypothetical protein
MEGPTTMARSSACPWGLGPSVVTRPTSRKVGTAVTILGNKLRGVTKVSLNGKTAAFTVNCGYGDHGHRA